MSANPKISLNDKKCPTSLEPAYCRIRRERLLARLTAEGVNIDGPLGFISNDMLLYLANINISHASIVFPGSAALLVDRKGATQLIVDNRFPLGEHVPACDVITRIPWYDGRRPPNDRVEVLWNALKDQGIGFPIDHPSHPQHSNFLRASTAIRRHKDPDEIALIRHSAELARQSIHDLLENPPIGLRDWEIYSRVTSHCQSQVSVPIRVYGDFVVNPHSARRSGMPRGDVAREGDSLLLDFSVVICGYRSDVAVTHCLGADPSAAWTDIHQACENALRETALLLKPGQSAKGIHEAMTQCLSRAGYSLSTFQHAGHGLGLAHPEAPFLVSDSSENLEAGDVVTLEPSVFYDTGPGVRLEHNYLISTNGAEALTTHSLSPRKA